MTSLQHIISYVQYLKLPYVTKHCYKELVLKLTKTLVKRHF